MLQELAPNPKSFKQPYYLLWKIAESYYPKSKMHDTYKSFIPKKKKKIKCNILNLIRKTKHKNQTHTHAHRHSNNNNKNKNNNNKGQESEKERELTFLGSLAGFGERDREPS